MLDLRSPTTREAPALFLKIKINANGNSLVAQWSGFRALTAEGPGSIPGRGTKIPQVTRRGQEKRKEKKN